MHSPKTLHSSKKDGLCSRSKGVVSQSSRVVFAILTAVASFAGGPSLCASVASEALAAVAPSDALTSKTPPERVEVLPVFFVPQGQQPPAKPQIEEVMAHLRWAQTRYAELLRQDTFAIAEQGPKIYLSSHPASFYRDELVGSAAQFTSELLEDLHFNRFTCPFVFLVLVSNDTQGFSRCGARPLNGGHNNGGGIVEMTCNFAQTGGFQREHPFGLQNCVQHELGHAFGLVHPNAYGYDLYASESLMSYNPALETDGFVPRQRAGTLIPEDLRALALNKRVFAGYGFDPAKDVSAGYGLKPDQSFAAMAIPGQEVVAGQDNTLPFDPQIAGRIPLVVKVRLENDGEQTGAQAAWVGSKGKGQKMLGFSVAMPTSPPGVQLQCMANIFTMDDTPWVDAGTVLSKRELERGMNTSGQPTVDDPNASLTGLAFRLTGEASGKYEVWYQGHFSYVGDSAWCKDGEFCGPRAPNCQKLESFVVAIVPKSK